MSVFLKFVFENNTVCDVHQIVLILFVVFFRIRENRRDPAIVPIVKNFVAYLIDLEHRRDPGQQIVMLFDMTGAGLANFDTDLVRFIITCFDTYFPHFLGSFDP